MTSPKDYEMLERMMGAFGEPSIRVFKGQYCVRMYGQEAEGATLADAVLLVRGKLLTDVKKSQAEEIARHTEKMGELDGLLDALYGEASPEWGPRPAKAPPPTPPAPPQGTLVPAELLDQAYQERNLCMLLAARLALALGWRAGLGKHNADDPEWEREWTNILFLDTPAGQLSWHLHDSELPDTQAFRSYSAPWDGHTTQEKYARVRALLDPRTGIQALPHSMGGVFPQTTHSAPVITDITRDAGTLTLDDPKDIVEFERIPWEDNPVPPSQRILDHAPQLGGWRAAVAAFEAAGFHVDHGYKIGELKFSVNKKNSPFMQVTIQSFEPKVIAESVVRLAARWDDEVRKALASVQKFRMTLE